MDTILERDTDIHFPNFSVLKASAGSGKTRTLTERFVEFLLSERIPHNGLRNILAITFSNNAAKEMKERVLLWLKSIYFDDPETMAELSLLVSMDKQKMIDKAGSLIDYVLHNYSDFQVKTIDSFMVSVFKASAIDFGYNPEFDILMNNDSVMEYSFNLFLRNVREGSEESRLFEEIIFDILRHERGESAYLWDPFSVLLKEIKNIYRKLSSIGKDPLIEDFSAEMSEVEERIRAVIEAIEDTIVSSGLQRRGNSSYITILPKVREGRTADLIGRGITNPPVNKPKTGQPSAHVSFNRILKMWAEFGALLSSYTSYYVRSCYIPYLKVYEKFRRTVDTIKKRQGTVFIEDINWKLTEYLDRNIVPDVYFRLGERIFHFLIDEFQDTSPIQWRNLAPLIENSLSQGGSAFVVGDTKQAIYGFRNADYTIMKAVGSENPFPSARYAVQELTVNYRSLQRILEFNEKVFKGTVADRDDYKYAGEQSGLTDYTQKSKAGLKESGYAEVSILEKHDEEPPERRKIQDLVFELRERGYRNKDIAILTQRNEDAVRVTAWLNEKEIPFISFSSLDIRRRKVTGEIVSLLYFLDSPTDNHALATFILGDVFSRTLAQDTPTIDRQGMREFIFAYRDGSPLYKCFQKEFGSLWEKYFSGLFKAVGYLPLYDLISEIFSVFRVFEILSDEEATLVKILEVVKDFEGEGYNSLRDFLEFADDGGAGDSAWNMSVPKGIDAVQVMTIHKSKGLGFPVVITLLYEERSRGFDYIVQEDRDGVRLLRITRDTAGCHVDFEGLYALESIKEKVNRLNTLYVGFTRPKEELYVIGVKGKRDSYPLDILPAEGYLPGDKPGRSSKDSAEAKEEFSICHRHKQMEFHVGPDDMINLKERKRGEFIHRILSFIEWAGKELEEEISAIVKKVREEKGFDDYADDETKRTVVELLTDKEMAEYFQQRPSRKVRNEQEFSDGDGNLFRMDRVVIDSNSITVIDYKTGSDKAAGEKYEVQMKNYMKILGEVYPKTTISGIIAYIDRREVKRINPVLASERRQMC